MPSCYLCGSIIQTGQGVRRRLHSGASVSGFNFSSNVLLNWLLNSLLSKRPARLRNYYSLHTICANCAMRLDAQQQMWFKALIWVFVVAILIIITALSLSRIHS
jgi:hypothetical protein